jgi:hypothetical protein
MGRRASSPAAFFVSSRKMMIAVLRERHVTLRWTARAVAAALLMVAAGCRGAGPDTAPAPKTQRDVIMRDELLASARSDLDLYQAIRSLRPHFLVPAPGVRRASAPTAIAVYLDGVRQAGVESLRSIGAGFVEEVRYLSPTASQNELGVAASGGAIMVKMHRPTAEPDNLSSVPTWAAPRRQPLRPLAGRSFPRQSIFSS